MSADQASHVADLHKIAAELGPRIQCCKADNQLNAAMKLHEARDLIYAALRDYKPAEPKREQQLEFVRR